MSSRFSNGALTANPADAIYRTLTYVAEITVPSLRGILATTASVAIIAGILIQFILGSFFNWRTVALFSCSVNVVSFLLLFFVPDSPHWLISKNRFLDARKSLAWLRGWTSLSQIEPEFQQLSQEITVTSSFNWKLYTRKSFLWPYALVSFAFFLGHFSGMTPLQTYSIQIFALFNSPIDKYHATVALGAAEVVGCVLSASLVHFTGKRTLNFFSLIGCGACFLTVGTYAHYWGLNDFDSVSKYTTSWVPMAVLIAVAFFSYTGIRILPWMLIGEVFPNETRATASGISSGTAYVFGFVCSKVFLKTVALATLPGTFWLYASVSFVGTLVLFFCLPETEGKTLFEITKHFGGSGKLDNNVEKSNKLKGVDNAGFRSSDSKLGESKF